MQRFKTRSLLNYSQPKDSHSALALFYHSSSQTRYQFVLVS